MTLLSIAAGAASAAPATTPFQIPRVWYSTIFGICTPGCVDYPVAITGETPGIITFPAPRPFTGAGAYWVHWHNLGTGASGVAPIYSSGPAVVHTGSGVVTATLTAGNEYFGANGIFVVP
ncbi:hypothetical protein JWS13_04535 (plasmid) [Rhodococcus pseudokoreensis]|uniref:Uncharacterized protein n=1 Tax=Rhodococcus pseudokoreensis TaxID=2811421 RepID=A0A974VZD8_9NOCA|nr:hypothetical protein [Rhodococcus pseudokoreensis]QSE87887.1 hypothetical protein JWS13_04535 [Rhodococcus pseudokoreensis]